MRAFISLKPCDETQKEFAGVQKEFMELLGDREVNKIKWETPGKYHLTMFFIGDVDNKKAKDVCSDFRKLNGKMTGEIDFESVSLSAFPDLKYPRVIISETKNQDGKIFRLNDLIVKILDGYGFKQDKKFHPHITLGRVRRDRKVNIDCIEDVKFLLNFKIHELFFMESVLNSEGAAHTVVEKFDL